MIHLGGVRRQGKDLDLFGDFRQPDLRPYLGSRTRQSSRIHPGPSSSSVIEPITNEQISRIRAEALQLLNQNTGKEKGTRPILVFEFLPGETAPGSSEIGVCYDLASFISRDLAGAKLTVAFLPKPLTGFAVLPAVACTEIVMGSTATLGPITPEGQMFDAAWRDPVSGARLTEYARSRPAAGNARPRRGPAVDSHGR